MPRRTTKDTPAKLAKRMKRRWRVVLLRAKGEILTREARILKFLVYFSKGVLERGVVRAAFTQTVSLFFVAHTKLTVWLCLAKLTPPNTPDTPCLPPCQWKLITRLLCSCCARADEGRGQTLPWRRPADAKISAGLLRDRSSNNAWRCRIRHSRQHRRKAGPPFPGGRACHRATCRIPLDQNIHGVGRRRRPSRS